MYVGIDVGGTNLKAGLVDEAGRLLATRKIPLGPFQGKEYFVRRLAELTAQVSRDGGVAPGDLEYVGMGIPGAVAEGNILYTCNIPLANVPIERLFSQYLDVPVLLENDANCAAVGEYFCGAGRGTKNFAVVTLGTGIGGGFILGGKLYAASGMSGEVGHMVVERNGAVCNCGRRGCWETYASATGLIRMTKEAMEGNRESLLWEESKGGTAVSGRTAFAAALRGDVAAKALCETYVDYLAAGIVNLLNILQPEVLAIGGGVSEAEDELLLTPLREIVDRESYAAHCGGKATVVKAELGNDAGIIGAALLKRAI
ncbi:ROK family protein [Oscillibacter ruminantium]|jgi:glucokinase|uniref:ROK family protein n=1 Tax=Oscillibacter ruminantium TaxID=1263547 RepID=UPI0002FCF9CF|nr:ROK family protein [Oscillibacter ruminantium]MDN0032521.1 ROK family protein [Oscillibacter valericigenes]